MKRRYHIAKDYRDGLGVMHGTGTDYDWSVYDRESEGPGGWPIATFAFRAHAQRLARELNLESNSKKGRRKS